MDPSPEPLSKPIMVYDGDCTFCRRWIARWKKLTGSAVQYAPSQEVGERFGQAARPGRRAPAAVPPVAPGQWPARARGTREAPYASVALTTDTQSLYLNLVI